jgi:hypothetical protein
VFVPLTAVLELEWVMRGFYELPGERGSWRCSRKFSFRPHESTALLAA